MPVANFGHVDIHYEVLGDEGPVVLFISGLGMRGEQWTPLSRALVGRGFRAVQFDNRDIGNSSQLHGAEYEIADMAADALSLLDHLGIEKANIVSISMGGMIAQELLLRHPTRFSRAVLMATWPGGEAVQMPEPPIVELLVPKVDPDDPVAVEAYLRTLYAAITAPGFVEKNQHLIEMVISFALAQRMSPQAMARQVGAVSRFSSWDRLTEVQTPTLVVHGDLDPLIPYYNGELLHRRIPGAQLRTLVGVGHLVPLEAPLETFGAIVDFLS